MRVMFDPAKNRRNAVEHGVTFEEAQDAVSDPFALVREDEMPLANSGLCLSEEVPKGASWWWSGHCVKAMSRFA